MFLTPYVITALTLVVRMGESIPYHTGGESYLSDVNLERFYIMEENAMSNADVLVRKDFFGAEDEETEEEHQKHAMNLTQIESILARTKDLHRDVGPDLWTFLGHPINLLHLFRRLKSDWTKGLELLLSSTPCKLWKIGALRRYLLFLQQNMPDDADNEKIVNHLTRVRKIWGKSVHELANGKLGNIPVVEPLSLNDQFYIAKILYEQEAMKETLPWLELIDSSMKEATPTDKQGLEFTEGDLYRMMGSAYYMEGRLDEAVNVTDRLLELDLSNKRVQDTLNFFIVRKTEKQLDDHLDKGKELDTPATKMDSPIKKKHTFEQMCSGLAFQASRKSCVLESAYGEKTWVVYKQEILRHQPPIALYHDVIDDYTMKQLIDYSRFKLTNKAWVSTNLFTTPHMSVELDYRTLPKVRRIRYATQRLSQILSQLPCRRSALTEGWGKLEVMNVGRSGTQLSSYMDQLDLFTYGREKTAAMFAFLSEPQLGGDIVMKRQRVFSPAPKGSILFYYPTKTRIHALCPAIGDSQWVAVQPLYEKDPRVCLQHESPRH